jgi:predicted transcriptional regulator
MTQKNSEAFTCFLSYSFSMTKTITLRLQDNKYQRFQQSAECDNRSISNFIENAVLRFIEEEEYLDDFENN